VFLPEQERVASRFSPTAAHFDAVSNVKTFNHVAPRIGAIYDLSGDGKMVIKANFGRYYFNPGVNLADALNPNTSDQFTEYAWTDRNGDRLWETGEEGAIRQQVGGTANVQLDPNLRNSRTDELSAWVERELGGQVAVRAGFVWKMDRDGYFRFNNFQRPYSAYNVPITVRDPGPDGTASTGDDRIVNMLNLNSATLALPTANRILNPDGFEANYKNIEIGATKHFGRKWGIVGSFLYTWTDEFAAQYLGGGLFANGSSQTIPSLFSGFGSPGFALSPNDDMHSEFTTWGFKVHGSWEPAWGLRITPIYRMQQGYPYGRVFTVGAASGVNGPGVNYGTQNLRAEPLTSHRQDTVKQLDFRAEKKFKVIGRTRLALIFDVYNVFNARPELNIRATTGRLTISESGAVIPTFNTPVTILPPRIARLSARLDW
jgi:hypothetical protein